MNLFRKITASFTLAIASVTVSAVSIATALPPLAASQQGLLFTLHGSNTVGARLAPELVSDYFEAKGLVNISINPLAVENEYRIVAYHQNSTRQVFVNLAAHGSSTGFKGLAGNSADIGMASRPIKNKEVNKLTELGDMRSFSAEKVVAIDGLAVIVHPDSDIYKLTIDQIGKVFSGEIDNWQELGARAGKINIYARDDKSGTWDTFKSLVLRKVYSLHSSAKRFESNDEISSLVQRDVNGIGFVGLASVGNAKALAVADKNTRALSPTVLSVATEDYPLARRLFMYVAPDQQAPLIREFLEFIQSNKGQERVTQVGYIAQTPIGLPPKNLDKAPEQYRMLVENGERLSVNVRFKDGSASLDNKALQDILRLSQFMQDSENNNKKLLLIGFGDSKQSAQRALVLSKLRAIAVRSALREQGINTLPVQGLGDQLPVADNASGNKLKNQRVEIWLMDNPA